MKLSLRAEKERGLTLIELLVIIGIVAFLAMLVYPGGERDKRRAIQVTCMSDLRQVGLADRTWEGTHGDRYPNEVSITNGGTMEYMNGPNGFRFFQIMSNELQTPRFLLCPADTNRVQASTFNLKPQPGEIPFTSNSNLSYFIGLDVDEKDPQSTLAGDRNITNGTPLKDGILELTPSHPGGWTEGMHRRVGNILLADGSVQAGRTRNLTSAPTNTPAFTNRLLMPLLGP
jgi:type II secretory pathway pseudopilin PulG